MTAVRRTGGGDIDHMVMDQAVGSAAASVARIVAASLPLQAVFAHAVDWRALMPDYGQALADALKPMQEELADFQRLIGQSFRDQFRTMLGGYACQLNDTVVAGLRTAVLGNLKSITSMAATYGKLAQSVRTVPDVTRLPVCALRGAARELLVTGHALDVIRVPSEAQAGEWMLRYQSLTEARAESSVCIPLLRALDPALAALHMGAHQALEGKNPDRVRHVLTSLRELWNHVLRLIAPDEHVLAWIQSEERDLVHNGHPTKRARVLYFCRGFNHPPLAEFVIDDVRALIRMVEFFNRVHELELRLTDLQLRALLLRADSWLAYVLQLWGVSGHAPGKRDG